MFTGIIRIIGTIQSSRDIAGGKSFSVRAGELTSQLSIGDSVAISGVCHTVETIAEDCFTFTSVGETLSRTTMGSLVPGSRVNLEPAATPTTALGGHLVQGHVDGVGEIESFERVGQDHLLAIRVPKKVFDAVIEKGSITIDGVSLTIVEVRDPQTVTITIIPHTELQTIAAAYVPGVKVNVEADLVGKYVKKYVEQMIQGKQTNL